MDKSRKSDAAEPRILCRPHASNGYYLGVLLPACYAVNIWGFDRPRVDSAYKQSAIISFGLMLQTVANFQSLRAPQGTSTLQIRKIIFTMFNIAFTSFLLYACLKISSVLSAASVLLAIVTYDRLYFRVLRRMPKSFTLGEASVVCQGFVIFLYNALVHGPKRVFIWNHSPNYDQFISIIQIVLLGVTVIVASAHFLKVFRKTLFFWFLAVGVMGFVVLYPITGPPALFVVLKFVFMDTHRIQLVGFYVALLLITSVFVMWQIRCKAAANTITRKGFHVLVVLVYLPGLWYQCTVLYMGSAFILALLVLLETARIVKLRPISAALDQAVSCFLDEKDAGVVALTPLYLLVGCSLPMWLHPVPCDLTDSAGLDLIKLMAGVLSVGIGDTMASASGYYFGRHKWPGSSKSVEGTLASIAAQVGTVYALHWMGYLHLNTLRSATAGTAIIINGLIEAKTDQVDNLALPLVTYIILGTL